MHALLIACVIAEAGLIGVLFWKVRQLGRAISTRQDQIIELVTQLGTKADDLVEGCERIDSDLSAVTDDVREISTALNQSSREVGERIAEIAGEQEKIRRSSSRPAASGAWESLRNSAGRASRQDAVNFEQQHDKLVALAEGS